ncbi:MAG: class I SAM-dependent methyltransferase [Armatimonadetes bacterium]|nr:class I SAM-dependent methyltransferase [Armatimonadota bacterium]
MAQIHSAAFTQLARGAAVAVNKALDFVNKQNALIFECGVGDGTTAANLVRAGHRVIGVDQSPDMIDLARKRVPNAEFIEATCYKFDIPKVEVVLAVGEVLCYRNSGHNHPDCVYEFFAKVYKALEPGGIFIFDIVTLDRIPNPNPMQTFAQHGEVAMAVETTGNIENRSLRRDVTVFEGDGESYHKVNESHELYLFDKDEVISELKKLGFSCTTTLRYADFDLFPGLVAIWARKPEQGESQVQTNLVP